MSFLYTLKIFAYRFFNSAIGKLLLKSLSFSVNVKNLEPGLENKHPFIVSVTIDTESGYIKKNEHRVWQKSEPHAYMGFYKGIGNWRSLLNKYKAKATFFLSTNCFSAKGKNYGNIIKQLKLLLKEGHEIGLHLHPDSDLALQSSLKRKFKATSAKYYTQKELYDIIESGKSMIKKHLGVDVSSIRWGNWGLSADAVKAIEKNRLRIDSSATPGIKGHLEETMHYDWSGVDEHYSWRLSSKDYQNTAYQDSKVLEIPIATVSFMGMKLRADPVYSELLKAAFDCYYANADRSKKPFVFVVISHSIESTYEDGSKTKVIDAMEEFILHTLKFKNVKFMSLRDSARL